MSVKIAIRALAIGVLCLILSACDSVEERAEAYFESAQELISAGDADRAIIELRNVFQLVPNHIGARQTLARLQIEQGNRSGAYRNYLRLVEQVPDDIEVRTTLAELAFEWRNWEEFVRHGERAVTLAPETPRGQIIDLALQYRTIVMDRDWPAAEALATHAEDLMAQFADSRLLEHILFDNYIRRGDTDKALAQLDKMIARAPEARDYYDQRLVLLSQNGDSAAIEAHLRNVVEIFPDDADAKRVVVQHLLSTGARDKAETFLREVSDPADPDPAMFITLVRFLKDVHGNDAARAELDAALLVSPEPDRLRMIRAVLDYEDGQRDVAIADLEEIIGRTEPSDLTNEIKTTLSLMLRATGNAVGAQRLISEVLEADADNVAALKIDAAWLIEVDETDLAIAHLRRALDSKPEDEQALNLMADAYMRAGSHDLARDFVAQAVDVSGNAPASSLRYARILITDGNERAAEEVLLAALRREPVHEEILVSLGEIYIRTEDFTRAEIVVQQLRRIGSKPVEAVANRLQAGLLAQREGSEEALAFLEEMAQDADAGFDEKIELLRARLATGQPEIALQMAEDMVAEAPEDAARRILLALTRAANGQLAAASVDMRALVAEDPTRVALWQQLYRIAQIEKGPEAANAVLQEGLEAMPDSPILLWIKAVELEMEGRIDEAIAIYEDFYARDSNSLIVANNLASLLVTYKEDSASLERAWAIARRLRNTDVPAFQDTYGWLAFRRGDLETALTYMEDAAEGMPQDPIVQYHLAEVYAALKRSQDAIAAYQQTVTVAAESDPRPQIELARQQLARLQQATPQEP